MPTSHQTVVQALNSTPLSLHLEKLMGDGGGQYLTLSNLAMIAAQEQPMQQDPTDICESLAMYAMERPKYLYDLLSNPMEWDEPADWIEPLEETQTLEQAIRVMAETLKEVYPSPSTMSYR